MTSTKTAARRKRTNSADRGEVQHDTILLALIALLILASITIISLKIYTLSNTIAP